MAMTVSFQYVEKAVPQKTGTAWTKGEGWGRPPHSLLQSKF